MTYYEFVCSECEGVEFQSESKLDAFCFVCEAPGEYKHAVVTRTDALPYMIEDDEELITEEEMYPHGPIQDYSPKEI